MTSKAAESGSLGTVVIVLLALCWAVGEPRRPDTKTMYFEQCDQGICRASIRTHLTAVPEAQTILYSDDTGVVSRLEKCAVVDSENWTCNEQDTVMFTAHGQYTVQGTMVPGLQPVSWWHWRYLQARHRFD